MMKSKKVAQKNRKGENSEGESSNTTRNVSSKNNLLTLKGKRKRNITFSVNQTYYVMRAMF